MTDERLLLGVDAGLTNVKAAVFDAEGRERAVAVRPTPNERPEPNRVERDLSAFFRVTCETIREAVGSPDVDADRIAGVGIAGHGHGLYALDEAGDPIRDGITSLDSRASDVVASWREDGRLEEVRDEIGYEPFVADPLSLLGWMKREEPDAYDDIDRILSCKDYLKYRLTDVVCTDEMEASVFYDVSRETYSETAFEILGLEDRFDALPDVVPSWETCGEVTAEASEKTGLPVGTPVASGLHDVGAVALGAGAFRTGQATLIVGTWGQSIYVTDDPDPGSEGLSRRFLRDSWLRYRGTRSAAAAVDWFTDEYCGDWRDAADSEAAFYDRLNDSVADVPIGSNGLLFLPYLRGSTDDPDARGGFVGLTAEHGRPEMLRSIYEGVALSSIDRLRELTAGKRLTDVRLGGGGAKSRVWSQMFADVLGEQVVVPSGEETGARGVAICAGIAAGLYEDHETAVERTVGVARRHDPTEARTEAYRSVRDAFRTTVSGTEATWEKLKAIEQENQTDDDR
ncbi:L-xylulokinase [Halopelagius inordinatus]|uniref:L-xylulokinase n=1 Tax=Halopelagius inordinatus TaxID=553467 RepID=A0A1I2VDC5_9EURY|nr:FGGY-family carbohydrate kinase [Halopelagius inordinatus]SFG86479.1 L-xylulokinase [Halopelagius inordinatus]